MLSFLCQSKDCLFSSRFALAESQAVADDNRNARDEDNRYIQIAHQQEAQEEEGPGFFLGNRTQVQRQAQARQQLCDNTEDIPNRWNHNHVENVRCSIRAH